MKVKSAPTHQANWKRVRKSLRAELSAYLAAPPKGRACHPREGGASQPHFDDFAALTSSQGVLYLKNSATTIKHLLEPFQKLEKGYGRNLHGFSVDIETFLQRLQGVIDFLDRENEIPTRQDVIAFLVQRRDVQPVVGGGSPSDEYVPSVPGVVLNPLNTPCVSWLPTV